MRDFVSDRASEIADIDLVQHAPLLRKTQLPPVSVTVFPAPVAPHQEPIFPIEALTISVRSTLFRLESVPLLSY